MKSKLIFSFSASLAMVAAGCGGDTTTTNPGTVGVTKVSGTSSSKYVSSSLTLPTSATVSAYDLDGDGKDDNQLGSIIQAVTAIGLDGQAAADTAVMNGGLLFLFNEVSSDSSQQSATDAGTTFSLGTKPATAPKYDGTDTFTVSGSTTQFYGNIAAGVFTSNASTLTTVPNVALTVSLPLVPGQDPLQLPVVGAHIKYTRGTDGKITAGQFNAAIKKTDVDGVIIPAVAALLTAQLKEPNPPSAVVAFDNNPKDGMVTAAELMGNVLIGSILKADVQMFQNGVYSPTPNGTVKDSLSIGFKFTAVPATF